MKEDVIKALQERGYEARLIKTIKNGVNYEGVSIKSPNSNVAPTIYPQWDMPVEQIVEECIKTFDEVKLPDFHVDVEKLMTPEFWQQHLVIALQRSSNEDLIKMNAWKGTEAYLRLAWDDCSIKLIPEHLKRVGMTEDDAWGFAYENTEKTCVIETMADALIRQGAPEELRFMLPTNMYVATNQKGYNGASASLCEEKLKELCIKENVSKLIIIPASIHETILIPMKDYEDMEQVNEMVKDVNATQVSAEEQLSDEASIYEMK